MKKIQKIFFMLLLVASNSEAKVVLIPMGELLIPIVIEETRTSSLVEGEVVLDQALLLSLVNEARTGGYFCGSTFYPAVSPIVWSPTVESATRIHSDDMYRNDFFEHTGSDGSSAGDRLSRVGYNWQTYGENIALGYTSEASVIAGWLGSAGHCSNIMSPTFQEMGLSRVGSYWTQCFATSF
ncbi:MAG: CAP domain-containing protein [Sulfurovum sp.]|nr:CAP domain-containing protein [Sulfurovum sp.]